MLAPHHAVERKFQGIGVSTEHRADLVQFGIGETKGAMQGLGGATHPSKLLASATTLARHVVELTAMSPHPPRKEGGGRECDDVDRELDQPVRPS